MIPYIFYLLFLFLELARIRHLLRRLQPNPPNPALRIGAIPYRTDVLYYRNGCLSHIPKRLDECYTAAILSNYIIGVVTGRYNFLQPFLHDIAGDNSYVEVKVHIGENYNMEISNLTLPADEYITKHLYKEWQGVTHPVQRPPLPPLPANNANN